jgi:hypothetical protein
MGASAPSFGVPPVLGDSTRGRDALAAARRLIYFDVDESHQRTRDTIRRALIRWRSSASTSCSPALSNSRKAASM